MGCQAHRSPLQITGIPSVATEHGGPKTAERVREISVGRETGVFLCRLSLFRAIGMQWFYIQWCCCLWLPGLMSNRAWPTLRVFTQRSMDQNGFECAFWFIVYNTAMSKSYRTTGVSHGATFQTPWQQPEMPARNVAFSERGTIGGMNNCLLYRKRLGVYRNLLINWIRPRGFRLSLILTWSSIFILIFKPTQTTYSWYNPSKTSNPLNIPLFFYIFFSLSVSSKGKFKSGNVPLCCLKRNPC